jgi:hypothetical protein
MCRLSLNLGASTSWNPQGRTGIALHFTLRMAQFFNHTGHYQAISFTKMAILKYKGYIYTIYCHMIEISIAYLLYKRE